MNERLIAALSDRYRIERELGQGGMATVYLAHDIKHERHVAIKVLREDLSATLGSGRFLREIKIAAQLQHPHILPLLDSGESDGFLYFVMPYIKGQSLRERLAREGELPVHEAVRLIIEVVDALVEAHEHGVVHRDIKPDNVMLSGRHALVTDFGVAKAISEATGRSNVTTMGVAVGTPTYMSPEQAAADPHVDHRSDIYSVGVMLYEMLSGRPPFVGNTPQQVLAAHVTEAPDPVTKRRSSIPVALAEIVARCLAKRPADRFQTATELHTALEPLTTSSTGLTPTHLRPTAAGAARFKVPFMISGVFVAAVAVGMVVKKSWSSGSAIIPSPIAVQVTSTGRTEHPAISPDGTRISYVVAQCDSNGLCLHNLIVQDIGGAGTLKVLADANAIYDATWSPDGRYLNVFASFPNDWGAYVVPATVQGPPQLRGCCKSQFLTTADTLIQDRRNGTGDTVSYFIVRSSVDGRAQDSIALRDDGAVAPSPDGKRLATLTFRQSGLSAIKLFDRKGLLLDSMSAQYPAKILWTPDGNGLLYSVAISGLNDGYHLLRRRIDNKGKFDTRVDTLWRSAPILNGEFSISGNGDKLVYVSGQHSHTLRVLHRRDLTTAKFSERTLAKSTAYFFGTLSPEGSTIALGRVIVGGTALNRSQISLIPSDSGAETPISPVLDTLLGWTWKQGGPPQLLYMFPQGKNSDQIASYDVASGKTSPFTALADSASDLVLDLLRDGRLVTRPRTGREFLVWNAKHEVISRAKLPRGLRDFVASAPSPTSAEIVLIGLNSPSQDSVVIYRINLDNGSSRQIGAILAEYASGVQWLDNGEILAVIAETSANLSLYRVAERGGLTRVGALPFAGNTNYSISRDGLRMAATQHEVIGDVWVVNNFGDMWRR